MKLSLGRRFTPSLYFKSTTFTCRNGLSRVPSLSFQWLFDKAQEFGWTQLMQHLPLMLVQLWYSLLVFHMAEAASEPQNVALTCDTLNYFAPEHQAFHRFPLAFQGFSRLFMVFLWFTSTPGGIPSPWHTCHWPRSRCRAGGKDPKRAPGCLHLGAQGPLASLGGQP